MRQIILFSILFIFSGLKAQYTDSLTIDSVYILGTSPESSRTFCPTNEITQYSSLQEAIFKHASAYARNFAPGQSSTLQILGAQSSQTNILWNGIKINNPMLGLQDLSIIPLDFFDESHISYIPSEHDIAIGGNLQLKQSTNLRNQIQVKAGISSLQNLKTHALLAKAIKKSRHTLQFYGLKAQNRYSLDIDGFDYNMENAQQNTSHIQYQGLVPIKNWIVKPGLWISRGHRNIADSSGGNALKAEQEDSNLRANLSFSRSFISIDFNQQFAYTYDKLIYKNIIVNDTGIAKQLFSISEVDISLSKRWSVSHRINLNSSQGEHPNYQTEDTRVFITEQNNRWKWKSKAWKMNLGWDLLSNSFVEQKWVLNPVAKVEHETKNNHISAQIARATRFPSLNDYFWVPELSNLSPEYSWKFSVADTYKVGKHQFRQLAFYRKTRNQIQWIPANGVWYPENTDRTEAYGYNLSWIYKTNFSNDWNFQSDQSYNFTSSKNITENDPAYGNQLIYVPKHKWTSSIELSLSNFGLHFDNIFISRRFTNADNSQFLNGFFLQDVSLYSLWKISPKIELNTILAVKNISNTKYQHQAGFYQPGRVIELTILSKIYDQ